MRIEDIIARCTDVPGRLMGYTQEGFLKEGETADIALLRIENREVHYLDRYQNKYEGTQMIKSELTVKEGRIVHRQYDFLQ